MLHFNVILFHYLLMKKNFLDKFSIKNKIHAKPLLPIIFIVSGNCALVYRGNTATVRGCISDYTHATS